MTAADEKKTRQIFSDLIAPHMVQQASDSKQTNISLLKIEKHLESLNGTVARNATMIANNLPHREDLCPKKKVIEDIRDNMVSRKAVVKAIIIGIPLAAAIFGIISHFLN